MAVKDRDKAGSDGLSSDLLQRAIDSRTNGRTLPPGVSWNPSRVPQYLSEGEQEEFDATGVMPKSASDRVPTERAMNPHFTHAGVQLTKDQVTAVYDANAGVVFPEPATAPVVPQPA